MWILLSSLTIGQLWFYFIWCQCHSWQAAQVPSASKHQSSAFNNNVCNNKTNFTSFCVQHYVIKFVSDLRQVGGFYRVLRFPTHKKKKIWPPRYNWNIVESGVKHHQTNQSTNHHFILRIYSNLSMYGY